MCPQDERISISDGRTLLAFSAELKGALASVACGASGRNLAEPTADLWEMRLRGGVLQPSQADSFSSRAQGDDVILEWAFIDPPWRVQVRLVPREEGAGVQMWWSAKSETPSPLCVDDIVFPKVRAGDVLQHVTRPAATPYPQLPGGEYPKRREEDEPETPPTPDPRAIREAAGRYGGLYPGLFAAVQFFAAYGDGPDGLYVGAHDGAGFTKTLLWDHREISFTFHQGDPDVPRDAFEVPYPAVLATFQGDWRDGADIYRRWAYASAPWCQRGALADTGPEWARRSVAWFYSIADLPVPAAEAAPRLRKAFALEGPVGVHQLAPGHADHSNFPHGELEDWLYRLKVRQHRALREHDFHVFEYRNGHKYTKDFPGYETARQHACRWRGRLHEEGPYGGGPDFHSRTVPAGTPGSDTKGAGEDEYGAMTASRKYPLVEMCMGAAYWRQKLLDSIAPCPSYGLIGNYIDQIGWNPGASRCDAVNHEHPLRGGNWYVQTHEQVFADVVRHYQLMGVDYPLLSHEFLFEPLIGLLNASLVDWDMRLLSYLYHPYIFFESHNIYGWNDPDLDTLRENLAHDFHSGRMPALDAPGRLPGVDMPAILRGREDLADAPALRMMRQWFTTRAAWLDYLNLGTMLHPPQLPPECGDIMASAWESPSGDTALFFSNATADTQPLVFDSQTYPLPAPYQASLNNRQKPPASTSPHQDKLTLDLAPDDTLILEAPHSQ